MRNTEITEKIPLLDRNGCLIRPGFARRPLFQYNREFLPVSKIRMKEWDYYLVMTEEFGVAFTLSDLGYVRMASASFLDFVHHTEITKTVLAAPVIKYVMPSSSTTGSASFTANDVDLRFESASNGRHVYCDWKNFYRKSDLKCDIWFTNLPEESMVIATPFADSRHFYLNQKTMCMPASGKVIFDWHVRHLNPDSDSGILDWGRGYWPYKIHWYWACGSGLVKGNWFGFNLGYGFGNTEAASENMIFWNGKSHKLDDVEFHIPKDPMQPWKITSSDNRFEAQFVPDLDRAAKMDMGPVHTDQHQYFGLLSGTAVLDRGQTIHFKDFRCAIEDIYNRF